MVHTRKKFEKKRHNTFLTLSYALRREYDRSMAPKKAKTANANTAAAPPATTTTTTNGAQSVAAQQGVAKRADLAVAELPTIESVMLALSSVPPADTGVEPRSTDALVVAHGHWLMEAAECVQIGSLKVGPRSGSRLVWIHIATDARMLIKLLLRGAHWVIQAKLASVDRMDSPLVRASDKDADRPLASFSLRLVDDSVLVWREKDGLSLQAEMLVSSLAALGAPRGEPLLVWCADVCGVRG